VVESSKDHPLVLNMQKDSSMFNTTNATPDQCIEKGKIRLSDSLCNRVAVESV
jgi:hypothetical protein